MTRTIQGAAWATLLALAAFQAYAQRFVISPDGMSYLDLSDAVVTGQWSRLVNLYWSPLYPLLIGVARAAFHAGPQSEIVAVHAVNLVCFVVMLGAFEYMLMSILSLAAGIRHSALGGRWGAAMAYALFGCFALTMTPLELTTPDLLSSAATFVAFGAMLRLREEPGRGTGHAVALGAALGLGALAKSFMVPWAVVCFGVLAIATRRRGLRTTSIAAGVWLAFVLPWSALLSAKAGRLTFGDAGRLTYAWYVNGQDPPSEGGVPPGALTPRTQSILPGAGLTPDTSYSDPMWADPARWNADVVPHIQLSDQLTTLKRFHRFYFKNLAPLFFLFFLIATAPRGSRRHAWWRGWIVYVPSIVGMVAYSMVIVTSRYVMAYILAGTLVVLATLPVARRLLPLFALFGLIIPIALETLVPETVEALSLITSVMGGMLAASLVPANRPVVWGAVGLVGLVVARIVFSPVLENFIPLGAAALAVLFWRVSLAAIRRRRSIWLAHRATSALAFLLMIVFVFRLGLRLNQDRQMLQRAANPLWGNVPWNIAIELASRGIAPGTSIALIGPHAESYWVRAARLHIVANVPSDRVEAFWSLSSAQQDALLAEFAASGATVAIASQVKVPDSSWTPVKFHGWIRRLTPPAR